MSKEIARTPWYLEDKRLAIPQDGLEVRGEDKPARPTEAGIGYVYLVVDCSGSMAGDKLKQARKGALDFAKDALGKGYLTGLIQFHETASRLCEPQKEISVLEQYLKKLEVGSLTHMAEGVRLAHQQLKGKKGARVMVIVTDGVPNGSGDPGSTLKAREAARKDGIEIIAIGTDDADQEFLKKLASRTELGLKVSKERLEQTIASSASMLPAIIETKHDKKTG